MHKFREKMKRYNKITILAIGNNIRHFVMEVEVSVLGLRVTYFHELASGNKLREALKLKPKLPLQNGEYFSYS